MAKVEVYQDKNEEFRWRVTAFNGRIVGASTESYKNIHDCKENMYVLGQILDSEWLEDDDFPDHPTLP